MSSEDWIVDRLTSVKEYENRPPVCRWIALGGENTYPRFACVIRTVVLDTSYLEWITAPRDSRSIAEGGIPRNFVTMHPIYELVVMKAEVFGIKAGQD